MTAYAIVLLIIVFLYTIYMGYNDGSIAIATTIVTRAMKPKPAMFISAVAQFITPIVLFLLGMTQVGETISKGIVYESFSTSSGELKAFVFVLSGLLSATIWGAVAFGFKLPNSTSHTLLGGLLGAGIAAFGFKAIVWNTVLVKIVLMVFLAPIIGVVLGFIIMKLIRRIARNSSNRINKPIEWLQRINLIILSCSFSANNVQKSIGVYMLIALLGLTATPNVPIWIVIIFAFALTFGMLVGGTGIVNTIGRKIFKLYPLHSISAQVSTNIVIILVSALGIPIATGQVMSSSIMGVGVAERLNCVRWHTVAKILIGWCMTLPIVAVIGVGIYLLIAKAFLGGRI